MLRIIALGGYAEMGRNMTAVFWNDQGVILDCGLHLENYIRLTEEDDLKVMSTKLLQQEGAIADLTPLGKDRKKILAIVPSHAHLDHIGGLPYLESKFDAPIICTPFTAAVLRGMVGDNKSGRGGNGRGELRNDIITVQPGASHKLTEDITIEFIRATHSTPHTATIAIHTPDGVIIYANDFKFDLHPTLGPKPDFARLKALGKAGVKAFICESTYSNLEQRMPSESIAKQMLEDILLGLDHKNKAIIVTTFSSHIARLRAICDCAKKIHRTPLIVGRSLSRYIAAAEECGITSFKDAEVVRYSSKAARRLRKVLAEGKEKYVLVVTGHQGEPRAILSRMVSEQIDWRFDPNDCVIFSCKVIPTPTNEANRARLESRLRDFNVRFFKDIHVSGHAAREDLREMLTMLKPEHLFASHGDKKMQAGLASLAAEEHMQKVHLLANGGQMELA